MCHYFEDSFGIPFPRNSFSSPSKQDGIRKRQINYGLYKRFLSKLEILFSFMSRGFLSYKEPVKVAVGVIRWHVFDVKNVLKYWYKIAHGYQQPNPKTMFNFYGLIYPKVT